MANILASAVHSRTTFGVAQTDGWRVIADDPPPHETLVLLYWMDWRNQGHMEAGYASTGERLPNGYSTISHHGDATHWMPLPAPPQLDANPMTGEALSPSPSAAQETVDG